MLIKEIYNPNPRTIHADLTVGQVVERMAVDGRNGYVVIDDTDHVCGIISLQDIAGKLLPTEFQENSQMTQVLYRKGFFRELCEQLRDVPVTEVMRTSFVTVDLSANILTILADFLENDLYIIPVVEQDHLIGVVTRGDVRKALKAGMAGQTKE